MRVEVVLSPAPGIISPDASLEQAMKKMEALEARHLVVIEGGRAVGVISNRDLLEATGWLFYAQEPAPGEERPRVREYMRSPPITVAPDEALLVAAHRMLEHDVGCLPVLRDGELIGLLSDLDILSAYRDAARSARIDREHDGPLSALATGHPISIPADDGAEIALELMRTRGFKHLPVLEGSKVVGLLSDRDLRRAIGRRELESVSVGECMSPQPLTAGPATPLSTGAALMADARISALPLLEDGELVSIFTVRDALEPCARGLDREG